MVEPEAKLFDLINALETLCEECIPVFPGRSVIDIRKLYSIVNCLYNFSGGISFNDCNN